MAQVVAHLSVDDLERGVRSARDLTAARHFQVIWLVARGRPMADRGSGDELCAALD